MIKTMVADANPPAYHAETIEPPTDLAGFDTTQIDQCEEVCPFYWDPVAATRAISFAKTYLHHTTGPLSGKPYHLNRWEEPVVAALFGWKRVSGGGRRFSEVYIEIPRKNNKTTFAAAMSLYILFSDEIAGERERGTQNYFTAGSLDQASHCYSTARRMIIQSQALSQEAEITPSKRQFWVPRSDNTSRAIPSDVDKQYGSNIHSTICDELHSWPQNKGREFYISQKTATIVQKQPITMSTTTAGFSRESICWDKHREALDAIKNPAKDYRFLPVVYAAPKDADWTDEEVWRQANPMLGISIDADTFRQDVAQAKNHPHYENSFRRLHLNQWTTIENRWLSREEWTECESPAKIPRGEDVYLGLDLSSNADLSALCILHNTDDGVRVRFRFWMPGGRVDELQRRDRQPYREWISQGLIATSPGATIDQDQICAEVFELCEEYHVNDLGYDPWNASLTENRLTAEGVPCFKVRQNFGTLNESCKRLESLIADRSIQHDGNTVMSWMIENVEVLTDARTGNIKPVRPRATGLKIDGVMALVMAIAAGSQKQKSKHLGGFRTI